MRQTQNINNLISLSISYIGMIFYHKSPRYITEVPEIYNYKDVKKVGVFVNASEDEIMEQVLKFDLQVVQLHGSEEADLCRTLKYKGIEVFKAFGVSEDFDFKNTKSFEKECDMFIFDTKTKHHGGSGKKFDWSKLKEYKGEVPFLLSGGISSIDIDDVINFEHKMYNGVDLNSGFELEPALKDISKLEKFITKYSHS